MHSMTAFGESVKGPHEVSRDDPQYFDLSCWPIPGPGQNWAQARMEQVQAVQALLGGRSRVTREIGGETVTISDKKPGKAGFRANPSDDVRAIIQQHASGLRQAFPDLVPARPWCTNNFDDGLRIRAKQIALQHKHIQLDPPKLIRWRAFDIDRSDAYSAAEDANLPPPNFIAVNPENGHSLTAYLLAVPVRKFDGARRGPIEYLAAVERGMRHRLGADPGYSGLIAKNPLHPAWRVDWQAVRPYELGELADALDRNDMRPEPKAETSGLGRNCDVFNDTRQWAYRNVLDCKRAGGSVEVFERRLLQIAEGWNRRFDRPLPYSELRHIAKSIAKWTWARFSEERFSALQSFRGKIGMAKRWAGHVKVEPWKTMGISRATYFRRKKAGVL